MKIAPRIPTAILSSVKRSNQSANAVSQELKSLINHGAKIRTAGTAKKTPELLFKRRLKALHKIELFETKFFLSDVLQIPELRFFVAYVVQADRSGIESIYPRIFYKDLSLAWRSASHFAYENDGALWIGKGDVRHVFRGGIELSESIESTTDLPLEMQSALEQTLACRKKAITGSETILKLILREGPSDRTEPYNDFVKPRELAASNPGNLINRGRTIASFKRADDPGSLQIVAGYEPDFQTGVTEESSSTSTLYGGRLRRFRIISSNRKIQYYFIAGPHHVWIIPPQATTTQLSSYGVRTIDVSADDDLFIPGYEYHHLYETVNGVELYSQIPDGFAGEACPYDDAKADASPWLEKIPLIVQFRRQVLN